VTNKGVFDADMWMRFLREGPIRQAPSSQVSQEVLDTIIEFSSTDHSPSEIWDFMTTLAKKPQTEVSSFVKAIFDVEPFYERP
jgi:hypothetical protein